MLGPRNNKESVSDVISAYRRRQQRAEWLLPVVWIGLALIIIGAIYLVYRLSRSGKDLLALSATATSTPTEMLTTDTPEPTVALPALEIPVVAETGTLAPSLTPTESGIISYTVKQGDTLASIAGQFGVGVPTLSALNPQVTPEFLNVGDQLAVPAQGNSLATATPPPAGSGTIVEYQVVAGDTLAAIAARMGSSVDAIVRENNLESADQIREGQTLKIPVQAGASPSATPGGSGPALETTSTPES